MHDMLQLTTWMFIYTSTLLQINITTQPVFALCFEQNTGFFKLGVSVALRADTTNINRAPAPRNTHGMA